MSKIERLSDEEIYDRTTILAMKHDLLCVFSILLDHLKKQRHVIQMFRPGK